MKHKLLGLLAGTALLSGLGAVVSQPSNASHEPHNPNITFECHRGATLTTRVVNTQTGQNGADVIDWNSRAFLASGYTPLRRCNEVSGRLRRLHVTDRLDYFTAGIVNGLPVICAVTNTGEICNSDNMIVTLSPGNESSLPQYLQGLALVSRGRTNVPAIQESGGRMYVPVAGILATASETTTTTPSESPSVAPETPAPTGGGDDFGW